MGNHRWVINDQTGLVFFGPPCTFQHVICCSHDLRYLATRSVLWRLKCTKFVFVWAPRRTPLGSSRRSPRPSSRLGRGCFLPVPPHSLDAYGASFSAPAAPHLELGGNLLQGRRGDKRPWIYLSRRNERLVTLVLVLYLNGLPVYQSAVSRTFR